MERNCSFVSSVEACLISPSMVSQSVQWVCHAFSISSLSFIISCFEVRQSGSFCFSFTSVKFFIFYKLCKQNPRLFFTLTFANVHRLQQPRKQPPASPDTLADSTDGNAVTLTYLLITEPMCIVYHTVDADGHTPRTAKDADNVMHTDQAV